MYVGIRGSCSVAVDWPVAALRSPGAAVGVTSLLLLGLLDRQLVLRPS